MKIYLQVKFSKKGHHLLTHLTFLQLRWRSFQKPLPNSYTSASHNTQWMNTLDPKTADVQADLLQQLTTQGLLRVENVHRANAHTLEDSEYLQRYFSVTASFEWKPSDPPPHFTLTTTTWQKSRKHVSCGTFAEVDHGLTGFKPSLFLNGFPLYFSCTFYYRPLQILWER